MSQDIDDIGAVNDTGDEPTSILFDSQQGHLSIENDEIVRALPLDDCIIGVQVSDDGRVWLCVNGVAWLRFKPHRREPTMPEPSTVHAAIQVTCPACNAPPGKPCNVPTSTGRTNVRWYHHARENVASGWASSSFTCPNCGRTSYNPNDVREGYCGACSDWTGGES